MTGWDCPAVKPPIQAIEKELISEEGFVFEAHTGRVVRRQLVLDEGPYGYCAPLYVRSHQPVLMFAITMWCSIAQARLNHPGVRADGGAMGIDEGKIRAKIFLIAEVSPA